MGSGALENTFMVLETLQNANMELRKNTYMEQRTLGNICIGLKVTVRFPGLKKFRDFL